MNRFTTDFGEFKQSLIQRLNKPLPGLIAQLQMSPPHRSDVYPQFEGIPPVESAVMLLIYPKSGEWHIIFIQRNFYNGPHSGQISFPGGKKDFDDESDVQTALRECFEEVGVMPEEITICGKLSPLYVPITNFIIQPIVGICPVRPAFKSNQVEVQELIEVPFRLFFEESYKANFDYALGERSIQVPAYFVHKKNIWGATAMIMSEFTHLLL